MADEQEARFTITYDGPEVALGRMDGIVLAGAILSTSRLVEHSTAVLYGTVSPVRVEVEADFESGSFSFGAVASTTDLAIIAAQLLRTLDMGHVLAVLGITGGGGLIAFVRWLRRRPIREIAPTNIGSNNVTVTTHDGDSTVIHADTVTLYQNPTIRFDLHGVVAPLEREGITEFRAGQGKIAETTVLSDDLDAFDPPEAQGEVLLDKESTEIVQLDGVNLLSRRKWRFLLPDGTAFSSSLDAEFLRRVRAGGEKFGAGDALETILRTVVYRDPSGPLRAKREIVRVVRVIPAPPQYNLGIGPGDGTP